MMSLPAPNQSYEPVPNSARDELGDLTSGESREDSTWVIGVSKLQKKRQEFRGRLADVEWALGEGRNSNQ